MDLKYLDRPFEVKAVEDDGTFTGYVGVFNNVDQGGDVILPGAFTENLDAWKAKDSLPPVLWQHRSGEPLGPFLEMREDNIGLWVKGKLLIDDIPRAKEARALLKAKAIKGMSIGYASRDDSYDRVTGVRTLKKLDLWEGSIVTFPMNSMAGVNSVKSVIDAIETVRDAESFLRDVGRLSNAQAAAFISRFKSLSGQRDSDELGNLVTAIQRNTALLTQP
ncbi:MAG: HK97 family phage prohead protease [Rhodoferax sp.]|nr:HK97 family phage prohead protease [Rhodoferax sp.]MDP3650896.1 HK97 family phage prohead protease [Rhodoferax sp.]